MDGLKSPEQVTIGQPSFGKPYRYAPLVILQSASGMVSSRVSLSRLATSEIERWLELSWAQHHPDGAAQGRRLR